MTKTGARRGRPPKAEACDTSAVLRSAALRLFAENGYHGTSIRAIARAVGLSDGALYAHYANKRAIFDAALDGLGPSSAVHVLEELDRHTSDTDPAEFIRELVRRLIVNWSRLESRLLVSVMVRDGLVHDPRLGAGVAATVAGLAPHFQRWTELGHIPPGLGAPPDLAYMLISPIAQTRILWLHATAGQDEIDAAADRVRRGAEIFIRSVLSNPSPAACHAPR
ncbi:AcrR family transcriptional regulator [Catenulispora sp. GP43]|uniref:TetR/AcrR family transcriptional regulator n=1 Tax=Catenulispora sp. GP43 TaxID=3156263 RepID=UPI003513997F